MVDLKWIGQLGKGSMLQNRLSGARVDGVARELAPSVARRGRRQPATAEPLHIHRGPLEHLADLQSL